MTTTLCREWLAAAALTLVVLTVPAAVRATDVSDVLARMRQAVAPGKDMRATVVFVMSNAKGENVRWTGHLYRRSHEQPGMRLTFDDPVDLRGTEVQVRGADGNTQTRLYLPSIRRVRDLQADMRGESFLGTDFNYEDLALQDLTFQRQTLVTGDGKDPDCIWVESIPERGWWCGKMLRCISKQTYLPRRTEYYSRDGTLWKVRTFDSVKEIGGFPTATEIATKTVPLGTSTRIILTDVQYDTKIPESVFERP